MFAPRSAEVKAHPRGSESSRGTPSHVREAFNRALTKLVRPDQNQCPQHFTRLMKRLAQQRRKGIDLMKRGGRVLKASMKLVQQRWTGSERLKHLTTSIHIYEIRLRADKRGVDLTSDVLLLGPLWYAGPNATSNAIKYAKFFSGSHDAVIRVYDEAGNLIGTHEHAG